MQKKPTIINKTQNSLGSISSGLLKRKKTEHITGIKKLEETQQTKHFLGTPSPRFLQNFPKFAPILGLEYHSLTSDLGYPYGLFVSVSMQNRNYL